MMPLGLRYEDLCVAIANVRKWRVVTFAKYRRFFLHFRSPTRPLKH